MQLILVNTRVAGLAVSDGDRKGQALRSVQGIRGAKEGLVVIPVNNGAVLGNIVSHLGPVLPVWPSQLEKLDRVGLDIDGKVAEVHDGVEPGLDEDHPAHQLVEVDVVIEGQHGGQAEVPEAGDRVAEDEDQDHHGVEEERAATGPGQQVEWIRGEAAQGGEVSEVGNPLDKQSDVDSDQERQEPDERQIILNILLAHRLGNLVHHPLLQSFLGSWFGRNKPFANGQSKVL